MQEAIQETRPRWKDESELKGIVVEMVTCLEDVPLINGNESELDEALINLVFNAVDAMPEGGTISIRTEVVEGNVVLTFSDTGKGMDAEIKERIFEPFFTTKADVGTGLGLSTVYNAVTRWGGSLEVESEPGVGTTFMLRFITWIEPETQENEEHDYLSICSQATSRLTDGPVLVPPPLLCDTFGTGIVRQD